MIRPKRLLPACLLWPLFAPASASALVVEIQGIRLETPIAGASCVEIAGDYPGVKIEASESGKAPRICYNSNKVNSIAILNATFVAVDPVKKDVVLKFEHNFPAGINGKIMARAKLQGFFSMPNGIGIPTGDKLSLTPFFSQNGQDDAIAEPFNLAVGDNMDSALFDYSVKEQYLISGPRVLKGTVKIYFTATGHKLTLADKSAISIDTGSTMADKLESVAPAPSEEEGTVPKPPADAPTDQGAAPSPEGQKAVEPKLPAGPITPPQGQKAVKPPAGQELPAGPIPFPVPSAEGLPSH